jgi:FkbM family methyltransferase
MDILREIDGLLTEHTVQPVLVDIGASGGAPEIWRPIARYSTYVGFDPDLREIRRDTAGDYRSGLIINKAVSPDPSAEHVTFYLTKSPYCSSMLPPDSAALAKYSFWELFEVTRTVTVPATTLTKVLGEQGLARIDWLKIDAQGADLRIYRSIEEPVRKRILAVDTEPGLLDAYRGEDLFVDVHRHLCGEGFWLSSLNVMGVPRISRAAMDALGIQTSNGLPKLSSGQLRSSPGWCEARYLRTSDWLRQTRCDARDLLLGWIFAIVDGQPGHALEFAHLAREILDDPALGDRLWQSAAQILRLPAPVGTRSASSMLDRAIRKGRRLLRGPFRAF